MHLTPSRSDAVPQVHLVRVREMLQPAAYKRFKYNLFRVHYQFVMANTKRYAYDFFMMCCGDRFLAETLGESLRYRHASDLSSAGSATTIRGVGEGQDSAGRALPYGSS